MEESAKYGKSSTKSSGIMALEVCSKLKTSLLRRMQAQTLPNATPPTGKINPFSKIAIPFEPVMRFGCSLRFRTF